MTEPRESRAHTVTVCWSVKGGSGTTVVAAVLGLTTSAPVLVVDLAGDVPAAYGLAEPGGPGVYDWLRSDAPADGFEHLAVRVQPGVELVPAGSSPVARDHPRWTELADVLIDDWRPVVVDAGVGPPPPALVGRGQRSLLVTRACYLGLRRIARFEHRPTGIVLVDEPGRALRPADVEAAVGAPIVASIAIDPLLARAVDSGLLMARLPRDVRRGLRKVAT